MIEWLDSSLFTVMNTVTVTRAWPLIALASLLIVWQAQRKRLHASVWAVFGLGGFIAASEIVRALIPDAGQTFAPGEKVSTSYTLWSDPAFRSDFGLLLVGIAFFVVIAALTRWARRYADQPMSQGRASAVLSAFFLALPLVIWVWAWARFVFADDYTDLVLPALGFVAVLAVSALVWSLLEGMPRNLIFVALVVIVILGQMRWNATRPPGSMFESNGSVPTVLALIPLIAGVLLAQTIHTWLPRRQVVTMAWQIAGGVWGLALFGWLVRFLGFYDFQNSYGFALGSVLSAPVMALKVLSGAYYSLVPGTVADDANIANMERWESGLALLAGAAIWLRVVVALWRRPVLSEQRPLAVELFGRRSMDLTIDQRRAMLAFVLITPAVLLRTFTTFYPFLQTIILSVQKYNPAFPPRRYIALHNFERLSTDLVVRESLEFTILFVFASTFFQMVIGLAVAHLLNANFRLRPLARTISLIPWAVPMVVAAIGFRWMFDDQFGMIPDLLKRVFDFREKWLVDPTNARIAVTFVNVWKSMPFCALLLLAGLQGINLDLYEAAKVDGANWIDSLRFITVPMLLPIIVTVTMFMLVWQLAVFDLPFAMTGGAPGFSTTVVAQKIYLEINSLNYSYAAAISIALVAVVSAIGGMGLWALHRVEVRG